MADTLPTKISLTVVTRERKFIEVDVDEVVLPASDGEIGVLPGHTPLLTTLRICVLRYRAGSTVERIVISWGFAEVLPDRVTILAQLAERAEDIDVARAEESKKRAEGRLTQPKDVDYERARTALMKSLTRLQVSSRVQLAGRVGRQRMPPPQA